MQLDTYKRREDVSKSTLNGRISALNRLESFIEGDEPEVEDVEEWVDHLIEEHDTGEIKASTMRQYLKSVRYYFRKVKREPDAIDHIFNWLPENDVDPGEFMTEEEWEMVIQSVHNIRNRTIIYLMYYHARRPTEIRLLNKSDIDLEEGTIKFNILKKKEDDRGRKLPLMELKKGGEVYESHPVFKASFELDEESKELVEMWLSHRPNVTETIVLDGEEIEVEPLFATSHGRISYDTIRNATKKAARTAGLDKNIIPKSNRHSRATHLDWAGHSPGEIARQQLLHDPDTGTDVVDTYVHERGEDDVRETLSTEDE